MKRTRTQDIAHKRNRLRGRLIGLQKNLIGTLTNNDIYLLEDETILLDACLIKLTKCIIFFKTHGVASEIERKEKDETNRDS